MTAFVLVLLWSASPAWADCSDTADTGGRLGDEDCDGDGFHKRDGDCNDYDAAINPGETEDCDDPSDENCDGFFNEGCVSTRVRGTLTGGSACGNASEAMALLLPFPLLAFLLRRRLS
jgi:hypothetical protein